MKKLTAVPTFDRNGILDGIEVLERIYVPDQIIMGEETINLTNRTARELPELPKHRFDVMDMQEFTNEEVTKLSLPVSSSARARQVSKDRHSDYFIGKGR